MTKLDGWDKVLLAVIVFLIGVLVLKATIIGLMVSVIIMFVGFIIEDVTTGVLGFTGIVVSASVLIF